MTQRQLEFRVGLFVIVAGLVAVGIAFQFSELRSYWEPVYEVSIHFDTAPGVYPSTPVRRNGVEIGFVRTIDFDEDRGGVIVTTEIRSNHQLRSDAQPKLVRSLLGDASIEISPGRRPTFLAPGARLNGIPPNDPLQVVNRLEDRMTVTLDAFQQTSRQWEQVARNLNQLMESNEGDLHAIIGRTARALQQLSSTLENMDRTLRYANNIFGDRENQENLKKTLEAMPRLVADTQQTIAAVKQAVTAAGANLEQLSQVTAPLAEHSTSIVANLDDTLGNLKSLSAEFNEFALLVNREQGSLRKLAGDAELYHNLNDSAELLRVLLANLQPIFRDMRIFSDKIARHPELIGVSGALRGSSGIKDPPAEAPRQSTRPGPLNRR